MIYMIDRDYIHFHARLVFGILRFFGSMVGIVYVKWYADLCLEDIHARINYPENVASAVIYNL